MNNLMICSKCDKPLQQLNESFNHNYIFSGVFGELDKMNRNQRIYPKEEYLKHLTYLRDDLKHPEKGWMLGELGHPADRFETDLKEASHRVLDVWYDKDTNQIKGKIELLDTPNGNIVKNLVDEGMPLCISSRASGSVGKDNKVEIQQIFTWDIVAKPGFEECVLHRVNESADEPSFSEFVKDYCRKFLNEEAQSIAPQYGLDEAYSILAVNTIPTIREEAKNLRINNLNENNIEDMTKHINETSDPQSTLNKPLEIKGSTDLSNPSQVVPTSSNNQNEDEKPEEEKEEKTDDVQEPETEKTDSSEDSEEIKILDVKAEFDDDIVKDVELVYKGESDSEENDKDSSDEESSEKEADVEDKKDEGCCKEGENCEDKCPKCGKCGDECTCKKEDEGCDKTEKELKNDLNEVKDKKEELEDHKKEFSNKLDDLIGKLKNKKETNEALIQKFPHAGFMNSEEFKKFAALEEAQQVKVSNWLTENQIYNPDAVNNLWESALIEVVNDEPIWLKNANDEYRSLYESASPLQKRNLEICAKYIVFESQRDVDNFWENSGLVAQREAQLLNEAFINNMPKIQQAVVSEELPYSSDFINMIGDMACEYNRR